MSVTADLIDFACDSGAISSVYNSNGIALTWDSGRSWQHVWDTKNSPHPQAFYGESEYLEPRVPTMISDYGEIMLKWAIMRIGAVASPVAANRCPLGARKCLVPVGFRTAHPHHRSPNLGRCIYSDGDAHNLPGTSGTQSTVPRHANRFR